MSENYVCFTALIPSDMTDQEIENRHVSWNEITPPSPISLAEAERRLAEDPFCNAPPVRGREKNANLNLAQRWAKEQEGIAPKVLLELLGPEAFELFCAAFHDMSLEIPGRDELLKAARPSLARDAAKAGRGAQKRLALLLDLTPARITQLAQTAARDREAEVTEVLEEAALLLEREKEALLQHIRKILIPAEK